MNNGSLTQPATTFGGDVAHGAEDLVIENYAFGGGDLMGDMVRVTFSGVAPRQNCVRPS